GRRTLGDEIDPAVGFEVLCAVGDEVRRGQPLVRIHARTGDDASRASARLEQAIELADAPLERPPLILGRIDPP
ncbi:MAG: cytidine deaminase, partial [Gemmatimonadota bacterium]